MSGEWEGCFLPRCADQGPVERYKLSKRGPGHSPGRKRYLHLGNVSGAIFTVLLYDRSVNS